MGVMFFLVASASVDAFNSSVPRPTRYTFMLISVRWWYPPVGHFQYNQTFEGAETRTLSSTGDTEHNFAGMPRSNTSHLVQTFICFARKFLWCTLRKWLM
jgi:hypothetical protein